MFDLYQLRINPPSNTQHCIMVLTFRSPIKLKIIGLVLGYILNNFYLYCILIWVGFIRLMSKQGCTGVRGALTNTLQKVAAKQRVLCLERGCGAAQENLQCISGFLHVVFSIKNLLIEELNGVYRGNIWRHIWKAVIWAVPCIPLRRLFLDIIFTSIIVIKTPCWKYSRSIFFPSSLTVKFQHWDFSKKLYSWIFTPCICKVSDTDNFSSL